MHLDHDHIAGSAHAHEHSHEHAHEHTHADGTTHTHCHTHDHDHEHQQHSPEEALALLAYMVQHNRHHAEELHELAHSMDDEAAQLIHDAILDFNLGNEKLDEALKLLKGE